MIPLWDNDAKYHGDTIMGLPIVANCLAKWSQCSLCPMDTLGILACCDIPGVIK